MRVAITGGSGFVGGHLAQELTAQGHEVVLLARGLSRWGPFIAERPQVTAIAGGLSEFPLLEQAFAGCHAVAHCAGINREIGLQTYEAVHVQGTCNVVEAARRAGIGKIVLMSFLRARPDCGSAYHESKWAAEEILRNSGLNYTIVKAGMVYGRGDHMLDHLCHSVHTIPFFASVGLRQKYIRPLAIEDLIGVLRAALVDGRLDRQTVAITGGEQLYLSEAARRVAQVLRRRLFIFPIPVWVHYVLAQGFEWTMTVPLVSRAQVRILAEGVVEPSMPCSPLPADLVPTRRFTEEQIRKGLPEPGPFGLGDLRCCVSHGR